MNAFAGRSALVTGGASGIGLATARALAAAGADVLLCGHDGVQVDAALAALRAGLAADQRRRADGCVADVRRGEDLARAVGRLVERTGRLDHLVCAAGIQIPGTALTMRETDWQAVLDVNLSGAYRACAAALPAMIRQRRGAIVIVSSVQAFVGKRNGIAYVAAKGGLNAMTRALALDHAGDGVRVNVVCPGVVDTPMLREAAARAAAAGAVGPDALIDRWAAAQPLGAAAGTPCGPADVADTILFLLGDGARYVTGSEFRVDGGLSVRLDL
ncbi:MAG: SDR family NAD(P)-dependent oxidoreductase [Lautropia sp.]